MATPDEPPRGPAAPRGEQATAVHPVPPAAPESRDQITAVHPSRAADQTTAAHPVSGRPAAPAPAARPDQVTTVHPIALILPLPGQPSARHHSPPERPARPIAAPPPVAAVEDPASLVARASEVDEAARTWRKTSSRVARAATDASDGVAVADAWRRTTRRVADRPTTSLRAADALAEDGGPRRVARYELREALGSGGCGTVFKAWDPRHERFVALKVVHKADEHARARFEREIKTTARLSHPSIVPLLDSGEHEGSLFLVMELVEGVSLDGAVEAGELDQRAVVAAVRDAALAVHHAHGQGVLHRDLKPHNILVDAAGRGLVTDFGLALVDGIDQRLTQSGSIVGTPAYMPPEQVSAQVLDARTDVYSLGATLYHALTKEPPFETLSIEELFLCILRTEARSPCALDPTIPRALGTICLKALEKEPAARYATANDLADELDRWLRGEPIEAHPPTTFERAARWSRHNPLVVVLAASTLLLAVLLAAVLIRDALRAGG